MKISHLLSIAIIGAAFASCSTPKDISYFQDIHRGSELTVRPAERITLNPFDKIFILVSTQDERLSQQFNLMGNASNGMSQTMMRGEGGGIGYTLTSEGDITFPVLGQLHLAGMTRQEVATLIETELQKRNLVKEPVVTVEYQNLGVVMLGAVNSPGYYPITSDKITILEAIAKAGDLNINGLRNNIKVMRGDPGKQTVYEIDLTSATNVLNSPVYYLQQNDIVYVEPSDKMKRTTTENGSTLMTYGFWMSFISFALGITAIVLK